MRLLSSSLLLLVLLPACGDDPEPAVLGIRGDRAELLAARQGTDAWQLLTADATGKTSFTVDRPFELVGACEDFGGEVYAYRGGPEDADATSPYKFDIGCGVSADAVVTVTTSSATPLTVFVGFNTLEVSAGVTDTGAITPGRHDIAILDGASGLLAIRRGVEIADGVTLDVDLTGAAALVPRPVTSQPAGAGNSTRNWTESGTRIRYGLDGDTGWSMPAALSLATDRHYVSAREYDSEAPRDRYRTVFVDAGATAPMTLTLPPHLASATLTWAPTPSATFDATGDWEEVSLFGFSTLGDLAPLWFVMEYAHAARTAGSLAAPAGVTAIPGWKAAWNPSAGAYYLDLGLSRETSDGSEGVSWSVDAESQTVRDRKAAAPRMPTAKGQRLAEMRP
jgi:hypothetical protein